MKEKEKDVERCRKRENDIEKESNPLKEKESKRAKERERERKSKREREREKEQEREREKGRERGGGGNNCCSVNEPQKNICQQFSEECQRSGQSYKKFTEVTIKLSCWCHLMHGSMQYACIQCLLPCNVHAP